MISDYELGLKKDNTPVRFFIIDDSAFMIKTIRRMLEDFGGEVVGSADGKEAIETIKKMQTSIDVITCDIHMPDVDGVSLVPLIKQINPAIIVVMVSAMGSKDKVKESILKGANYFIVKPFKKDQVFKILKSVLRNILA